MQYREKAFGKNFILSFLCNFGAIANLVFFLFFNRYLEGLGASKAQIGFYMGAFALGSVAVRPVVGAAVDKYGRKRLIYFGLCLMLLANAGYFLCRELNWVILSVRVSHGVGFGCYITGIFTVVVDDAPAARRAKVIGVFGLSGMTAFALLPMVGEFIIDRFGFQTLFGAALFTLIASLILSWFLRALGPAKMEFPPIGFITLVRQVDLLVPVGALFFFCTGVGSLVNFIAVYLGPMGISISFFFVASSTAGAIVRLFLGHWADVYGRRTVALPAFAAGSVALLWLGLFHFPWELFLCGLIWGAGIGFAVPAVAASVVDRVKPQDRGKGLALFTASFDLGVMAGSFAYGAVADLLGYSRMYLVASAVVLVAALIARLFRN
ncbi:MAG: MFS transporter [Candidatus Hydrogenedentota bacterium]|nr:MAG: MFS transporter [Candidatus Hydrogenedentota bacterium]